VPDKITDRQRSYLYSLVEKKFGQDAADAHNFDISKADASQQISNLKEDKGEGEGKQGNGQGEGQGEGEGEGEGNGDGTEYTPLPMFREEQQLSSDTFLELDQRLLATYEQTQDVAQDLDALKKVVLKGERKQTVIRITAQDNQDLGDTILPDTGHVMLPLVITALSAGENVMLVGPAGTGKSTLAEQAAAAMQLGFYSISLGPTTPTSKMFGYFDANGTYHGTSFRSAWEHGGLMLIDEYDNGHPGLNAEMNQAWAGSICAFPDGMVKQHPSFRLCTTANTFGRGADRQYVGRNPLDAATLDRFITFEILVDEDLELAIALAHKGDLTEAVATEWVLNVRKWRKNAEDSKLNVIISPRASISGVKLLAAGLTVDQVIQAKIIPGLSERDVATIGVR
jgi:MoxR-like ATPase